MITNVCRSTNTTFTSAYSSRDTDTKSWSIVQKCFKNKVPAELLESNNNFLQPANGVAKVMFSVMSAHQSSCPQSERGIHVQHPGPSQPLCTGLQPQPPSVHGPDPLDISDLFSLDLTAHCPGTAWHVQDLVHLDLIVLSPSPRHIPTCSLWSTDCRKEGSWHSTKITSGMFNIVYYVR